MAKKVQNSNILITSVVGISMLLFGVSQTTRPKRWLSYIPPKIAELLPVQPITATRLHGSINLSLGLFLLRRPSRLSAALAGVWWLNVLPLCARREGWQTGLRDAGIAATLFAVAVQSSTSSTLSVPAADSRK